MTVVDFKDGKKCTPKFKIGDRFYHKYAPKHLGTIVSIFNNRYEIRWDTEKITVNVPQINGDQYWELYVEEKKDILIIPPGTITKERVGFDMVLQCTCGVDAIGGGRHSDWCDKAER